MIRRFNVKPRVPGTKSPVAAPPKTEPVRGPQMRNKPNWENLSDQEETVDRLHIPPEMVPQGMSLIWATESVYGQPLPQYRARFERGGWTGVHCSDFDGLYDGMFLPKGHDGEVKVDGLVLMARPKELTEAARRRDERAARTEVAIKEAQIKGGDFPGVSLDTQHPSALRNNSIKREFERLRVPSDGPKLTEDD
jgi:hypothetical protein